MRKYQEPQMDILELEDVDTIVASTLIESDTTTDGESLGGDEGGNWNDFWS